MINDIIIKPFLDKDGKVCLMPTKFNKQEEIVKYLATKFDLEKEYKEIEVNFLLRKWTVDVDFVTIRRSLVDGGYIVRTPDGKSYRAHKEVILRLLDNNPDEVN